MCIMNKLQLFNSPEFGEVRVVMDANGEPKFCLVDVCKALGLRAKHVVERLSDGVVSTDLTIDSLGREQTANFVNEDGLYDVILDSRKPKAKEFRRWITSEVLPSIRKTGGYMTIREDETEEELMARALAVAQATLVRREERLRLLERENVELSDKVAEMKPKADYCDKILNSPDPIIVTQISKDYGMSPQEFNKRLHALGIQYKANKQWLLYAKYQGMGYTDSHTGLKKNSIGTWMATVWTQKGRLFLYNELKRVGVLPVIERYSGYRLPPIRSAKTDKMMPCC